MGRPGWSAGKTSTSDYVLTEEDKKIPAVDALDDLFKNHDIAYYNADSLSPFYKKLAMVKADNELLHGLRNFDINSLQEANRKNAAPYINAAIILFTLKLAYELTAGVGLSLFDSFIGKYFISASAFAPRIDPLILDLDGDGIETVGTDRGILFDHDGDGVRNGTGWVSADDGFLVYDKNNDGVINNGGELFGDFTKFANGTRARDGFDALKTVDINGDGKINASDSTWSKLKIWRDLNQDGQSQANELYSLSSLNISAINLNKTSNSNTLPNGGIGIGTPVEGTGEAVGAKDIQVNGHSLGGHLAGNDEIFRNVA